MAKNSTRIQFPRNVVIDINNVPEDFEERIRKSFADFTEGTAKDYTYQDKLHYIDVCRKYLHRAENASDCVLEMMKDYMDYEVSELGEIPDKEDYLSVEFMSDCFEKGRTNLYAHYYNDHHIDDVIMALLARAIRVVINYEPKEDAL